MRVDTQSTPGFRAQIFTRFPRDGAKEYFGTTLTGARIQHDGTDCVVWAAWNHNEVHGGCAPTRADALANVELLLGAWGL